MLSTTLTAEHEAPTDLAEPLPDLRDVACRLERVDVRYGADRALHEVTIDLIDGEITCVAGMPGSGRSTLARLVAGVDDLTFGRLWVDGDDASRVTSDDAIVLRRRQAALLGRRDSLIPTLTVLEHVELSLALDGLRPVDARRAADRALSRAGVAARSAVAAHRLSDQDRDRVLVAMAIAAEPRLVVADDFGAGQEAPDADRERDLQLVASLAAACAELGTSALLVSNDPEVAACCDRVVALDEGRLYADAYGMSPAGAARLIHELAVFSVLRG